MRTLLSYLEGNAVAGTNRAWPDASVRCPHRRGTGTRLRRYRYSPGTSDVSDIRDPAGFVATVAGIEGAWGFGDSSEEALEELESVLIDWASLKLEDGDDDIPSMEGVHLVIAR